MFWLSAKASKRGRSDPNRHRNICIALGCIAEKLAGPTSVALLTDSTLDYLIANLVCLTINLWTHFIFNNVYLLGSIKPPTSSTVFINCS
jgi:hypothetical protein